MNNWKTALSELGELEEAEHFENFGTAIDQHLLVVIRELGAVAMGIGCDPGEALEHAAMAAEMVDRLRESAITLAKEARDRAAPGKNEAAE